MRICRIVTVPFIFLHHLRSQIEAISAAGHEVYLVSSPSSGFREGIEDALPLQGVHFHPIEIPRRISPLADLRAIVSLYAFFRQGEFDVVHSVTTKAGLLCAIAAMAARVPIRLHTFAGQPWAELSGPIRWISKFCDWLVVRWNTQCYADSESQRAFLVAEGVAGNRHIKVLGAGSISGVDLSRFDSKRFDKSRIKNELAIPEEALVITFVGRITQDKGITELVAAFDLLSRKNIKNVYLVLVGPFESDSGSLPETTKHGLSRNPHIRVLGYTDTPEKYLAVADIFCLPSYREGFGSVVVEAAAMGVPAVATRVVGLVDSVVENLTGLLVPPKDETALAEALQRLLEDAQLRQKLGGAAQARAYEWFDARDVNQRVLNEYTYLQQR